MRHSEKQNYNEDPGARRTGQQARKRRQGPETQAKDEPEIRHFQRIIRLVWGYGY